MITKKLEELTEQEFLNFVKKICNSDFPTEHQQTQAVLEFEEMSEHPDGSDLIYYPKNMKSDTPEGIVEKVKAWRAQNGKSGFKATENN
jgi:hypothetical protein